MKAYVRKSSSSSFSLPNTSLLGPMEGKGLAATCLCAIHHICRTTTLSLSLFRSFSNYGKRKVSNFNILVSSYAYVPGNSVGDSRK